MILKSFKNILGLLIFLIFSTPLISNEKIDIWKKDNNPTKDIDKNSKDTENKKISNDKQIISVDKIVKIEEGSAIESGNVKIYGVYDPAEYDFNLNMWSSTKAEDVRASIKRLKKIKLSQTSNEILENVLLSFSYPPLGMNEKEFASLKINWLIDNNRSELIENFLKKNKEFDGKSKAVQYLVDENIAKANIKEGCKKIEFIDSTIKDAYLEKFRIYCLVFNNKKSEAQLLLDLLREQKQSDNFLIIR